MFRIIGVPIPKVKQENEKLCVKFWLYGNVWKPEAVCQSSQKTKVAIRPTGQT